VPRLLAVSINGQPRIFISGEDLTFAMLNQPKWGVFGYTTDSAQKIMTNMVLNGAGVKAAASAPAPAPAPATKPAAPKPDAKKTDAKK
jgi:hypothetical protein